MRSLLLVSMCLAAKMATAACMGQSPHLTAASAAFADVSACVTAATAGDTIDVPAGTATWSSALHLTKSVSLVGAGIGNTVITAGTATLIVYSPTTNADLFRVSGFTFDLGGSNQALQLNNDQLDPPVFRVRVDHNRFTNSSKVGAAIENFGTRGVADHNVFDNLRGPNRAWGDNSGVGGFDWSHYPELQFGALHDNFYYEDNTFNLSSSAYMVSDCDQGGRYVYRYNTFSAAVDVYPWLDWHGGRGVTKACAAGEIYGNVFTRGGFNVSWRGGRALFFYNSQSAGSGSFNVYTNDGCPATLPERHNSGYAWVNRNGTAGTLLAKSSSGGDNCGDVVQNSTYWLDNATCQAPSTCASISSGVGCGTLANRPASCTTGTAYWATDQSCADLTGLAGAAHTASLAGTLYRCTATDTWTALFTPMAYPHPLISGTGAGGGAGGGAAGGSAGGGTAGGSAGGTAGGVSGAGGGQGTAGGDATAGGASSAAGGASSAGGGGGAGVMQGGCAVAVGAPLWVLALLVLRRRR